MGEFRSKGKFSKYQWMPVALIRCLVLVPYRVQHSDWGAVWAWCLGAGWAWSGNDVLMLWLLVKPPKTRGRGALRSQLWVLAQAWQRRMSTIGSLWPLRSGACGSPAAVPRSGPHWGMGCLHASGLWFLVQICPDFAGCQKLIWGNVMHQLAYIHTKVGIPVFAYALLNEVKSAYQVDWSLQIVLIYKWVHDCMSCMLLSCSVMDWWPVRGVSCILPLRKD